jgi:hypothetical protein
MTNSIIGLFVIAMLFFACKQGGKQTLIGSWHAVRLENPDMDSFFANSQKFIDTMGKSGNNEANLRTYGTTNMDSMRKSMQAQYDSVKNMQEGSLLRTVFHFRKDSVAILSFNGNTDSARWHVENNQLVLDDLNKETQGQKLHMDILSLTDTVLKLKFQENGASSTVTFYPGDK